MMRQRAPISVIIPCYRCGDTVARAVRSVVEQTLPPEEVILVEDCSADGGKTLAALHDLRHRYPTHDIKVLELAQNGGPAVARNAGWNEAGQPYVAFLDADDSWHPAKVAIQYRWMAEHPEAMISGHLIDVVSSEHGADGVDAATPVSRPSRLAWMWSCQFSTISVMVRRDLKHRFEPDKRHAEDYLLWLQIVLSGHAAWRIEAVLAHCYKPLYGVGGLSGVLWLAEQGELDTYRRISRAKLIPQALYFPLALLSLLKYVRRLLWSGLRRVASR